MWALAPMWAWAQPSGIYTCVDAQGQRITADRPISACRDREQRVLSPSGIERARLGPVRSEHEVAEQRKAEAAELRRQQQAQDVLRREATLLARYPDRASHDAERQQQALPFVALMDLAQAQLQARQALYQQLSADIARYQANGQQVPQQLPVDLRKAQEAVAAQEAFVGSVQADSDKLQRRFDEELSRLEVLWLRKTEAKRMLTTPAAASVVAPGQAVQHP